MHYSITSDKETVRKYQKELGDKSWPEFMQHDKIVEKFWPTLYDDFSEYQFAVFDNNKIVGVGNMIPLQWNGSISELPDGGVDWALEKASYDLKIGSKANLIVAMQILISNEYRGKGISVEMVRIMKRIAEKKNIRNIALPVRPTLKHKYPLIPMEDYINWRRGDGLAFDPWIRVHLNLGGRILGICKNSMNISGTIKEWEAWSGLDFPGDGDYIVNNAVIPVSINLKDNTGKYIEPNVWIIHS